MDNIEKLTTFTSAFDKMIKKNFGAWDSYLGHEYRCRHISYTIEEMDEIIKSGSLQEQQKLSRTFFERDGLYKRIIIYYATLLKYEGILIPHPNFGKTLSTPFINKKYYAALEYIDKLYLPDLLTRISLRALVDGCYYGVIQTLDRKELGIIDLPAAFCRSRYKDLFGNDIIEFNVDYFYSILDQDEREAILKSYPKVIANYYRKYRNGKVDTPWVKIPTDIGICFPFFDDGRPLFLSVIPATAQYDDAVDTDRERDLEEIRKIIVQKIPHLTDGTLVFEPDEAAVMHQGAVDMMSKNKNLSILTTYADVDSIISKTTSDNVNNSVEKMQQHVYTEAGVSGELFAPTGSQALSTSITNDMALMMVLGNKYSKFITYILNTLFSNSNVVFGYKLLPVTWYNQSDYITDAFKLAQSGYSFLVPSIALGINQRDLIDLKSLENEVLDLDQVLIPLSSAYTQSAKAEEEKMAGRPEKAIEEKADETIRQENRINNEGGSEG